MQSKFIRLACPACHQPLQVCGDDSRICPVDRRVYTRVRGIWRCLLPERAAYYARFLQEYETVRQQEGRGSRSPAYYRALPYADLTGRFCADWRQRARSFALLLAKVVAPLEKQRRAPLSILDQGAGNGWLSYRLGCRGHHVAAVDLRTGDLDGLGALRYYQQPISALQAEFDHLPVCAGDFDLVIFNASLHYSTDYAQTLVEALRSLSPTGRVAIVDTPVYSQPASGEAMVRERQARFLRLYGFPSDAIPSENYLTPARLAQLARQVGISWRFYWPDPGWRRFARRWRARLRGQREPARFPVVLGLRIPESRNLPSGAPSH